MKVGTPGGKVAVGVGVKVGTPGGKVAVGVGVAVGVTTFCCTVVLSLPATGSTVVETVGSEHIRIIRQGDVSNSALAACLGAEKILP